MKLKTNERCPIHGRRNCCGRADRLKTILPNPRKFASFEPGVHRIDDPVHPRGYRERRSRSAMRRLLNKKIVEQNRICPLCQREFYDYQDIVPDHIEPRGMNAARRDDHPDNIQAAHRLCNLEKGSKRL